MSNFSIVLSSFVVNFSTSSSLITIIISAFFGYELELFPPDILESSNIKEFVLKDASKSPSILTGFGYDEILPSGVPPVNPLIDILYAVLSVGASVVKLPEKR